MMKRFVACIVLAAGLAACDGAGETKESEATTTEAAPTEEPTAKPVTVSQAIGDTVTTASGLQYVILRQGEGDNPNPGDMVTVHYTGTLKSDGSKFDSSLDRGQPFSFNIGRGRVIPGWDEGVMLMNKGTKAVLIIPSRLGYGPQQRPGIPANSDLIFEVDIVDIEAIKPHVVYSTDGLTPQTTNSGLEYYILEEGTGPNAKAGDMVSVHYYGYFKSTGERFDDSFSRGQPIQFALGQGQVIPGWEEGISLLNEGAKAKLVIPYHLAYGESGRGPIPPKADLVFDVVLNKIN